jgi:predicted MFS family arabinose efflux permease
VTFLVGVLCINAATIGQVTVVGKRVYDLTGSKLDLGLLGLAQFAPALVLVLLTGAVADRFDRRRVVAGAAVLQAAVALSLAAYVRQTHPSILPVFALVIAFGVAQAFAAPAIRSLPADMVDPAAVPGLTARTTVAGEVGIVAGPVAGGFLYVVGVEWPFVAFAALLLVGATAMLVVHAADRRSGRTEAGRSAGGRAAQPVDLSVAAAREAAVEPATGHAEPPGPGTFHDALEGLRFVRRDPVVLGAISLDLFAVLFGGAVALLPAIAKDRLGVGAVGLGWLQASAGLGAGLMTLVLATRPFRRHLGKVLLTVVAVFGAWTIVLGLTRSYALAFAALFILSGADAVSVYIRATLVPLATPEDMRGRVLAVENVFIGASNELGGFESGLTGQLLGTSGSILLGGILTVCVSGLWWVLFPTLRQVDGFPDTRLK